MRVRDIGERGLLRQLYRFCAVGQVGDDAAVMSLSGDDCDLVVTTDMLVDGVHFSDRTTSAADVGWRAAAANLSDLAAMGASPVAITVALGVNGDLPVEWVEQLYGGFSDCLGRYDAEIIGGDICRSPTVTVSITAFGRVESQRALYRSAARVGDAIVVTGIHGASRAGLALLLDPSLADHLTSDERQALIRAHQRPQPRLDVLPHLEAVRTNEGAIAGMDSSDGLADAISQICEASGVGARLQGDRIPLPQAIDRVVSPQQGLDWALYGGEDFELVLCLPAQAARQLVERVGGDAAIVGTITDEAGVWLGNLRLDLNQSFQHFG